MERSALAARTKFPLASDNHFESAFDAQDSEQMCS
jgi:hypothetical protein